MPASPNSSPSRSPPRASTAACSTSSPTRAPFIRTKSYFGPDRRRNANPNYAGPERRKGGKADVIKQQPLLDKAKTHGMSEADKTMSDKKANLAAVSTFADHEVILPPNKLKKAVQKVLDAKVEFDPVAQAPRPRSPNCRRISPPGWSQECDRLDAARHAMRAGGINQGTRDALFLAAHDIKGQAATFGFPLVAPVADSLCRLIEHTPDMARLPHRADRPACRCDPRHHDARTRAATAMRMPRSSPQKLRQVTDEFLAYENRDRPDYLEQILSPALAPG